MRSVASVEYVAHQLVCSAMAPPAAGAVRFRNLSERTRGVRDLVAEMPDIDRSFYLPWSRAISTSGEIAQGLPLVGRPFQMLMSLAEDTSVLE